ncbi:histidine phosphatase family protein [Lederbergia sp. NSJ-179]|uniref:histidine phosphatase family protein n=1 Tax=Lederbergia sp. NSJ-179 TaxID=2931402 RepID=UPI001FD0D395|nr:histidine phosphatase family protein [Lederbergia sp. NSJ-179]MCJ7841429.1 histidine phosphatase family protein [Lederbergia sp. NSJ-179]
MRATFIRHLPTEWNKKTWLQGRRDIGISPITEDVQKGMANNQRLLKELSPFDCVLASTLTRTQQTAQIYGYKWETEELLDELDFGRFEGLPKKKLHEKFGNQWIHHPKELMLGESMNRFEERIVSFLEKYKEFNNILVFGHGAWIRAVISYSMFGHINHMNKIILKNNECVTLSIHSEERKIETGG